MDRRLGDAKRDGPLSRRTRDKAGHSSNGVAAVDKNRGAGHEIRRLRGEKDCRAGAFLGRAETAGRRATNDLLEERPRLDRRRHVALDPSGNDRIDLYIMRRKLDRHRLRELYERTLARRIRRRDWIAEVRIFTRYIDDL